MIDSLGCWRGRRVAVAMSGGVDSSLAAAALSRAGARVIGIHMRTRAANSSIACSSKDDAADARAVAERFGFEFHDYDLHELFRDAVIEPFIREYLAGRTPNPCAICNRRLKFGALLDRARALGADAIATGHYARVRLNSDSGRYELYCAADHAKDQSYFLFGLDQSQLARIVFPLGALTKVQARAIARDMGVAVAEKTDSMEICFIPDNDYRRFLLEEAPERLHDREGLIVNAAGEELGRHDGVHNFTIGQRKGLRIAAPRPLYVIGIKPETQTVVVGFAEELFTRALMIERMNWVSIAPQAAPLRARVRIRYRSNGSMAIIYPDGDTRARIEFDDPVRAVTPGQAAVAFDENDDQRVLLGGWIKEKQ
ncbi:tRNA 2-thiouridine(34) synthase MnmA [bacterium]|nr:tRNA 2-thiouridine(34) synthase MnmA [bacterium]